MFIEHTHSWIHSLHTIWLSNNSFGTPLSQHFTDVYHIFSIPVNMPIGNQMSWPNSCTHLEEPTLVCLSAMQYAPILTSSRRFLTERKLSKQIFWYSGQPIWFSSNLFLMIFPAHHRAFLWVNVFCYSQHNSFWVPDTRKTTKVHHSFNFGVFPPVTTWACV